MFIPSHETIEILCIKLKASTSIIFVPSHKTIEILCIKLKARSAHQLRANLPIRDFQFSTGYTAVPFTQLTWRTWYYLIMCLTLVLELSEELEYRKAAGFHPQYCGNNRNRAP
ncbi:hypothetical protein BOTCAL_0380g00090 [Botryotinia calthae]|uniref:Uncharacterized protein n=1 Tax=Botryotinia calthae TaxID=38488 RepID=A0A4Y8CTX9_9HELO|nr:hypothetical protein BOTCAL_0380g00090 [Botryotinia calthae]